MKAEPQDDDIKTATNENTTVLYDNKESIGIQKAKGTPVTKRKTVVNDVKTHAKIDNVNEIENQQESNISNDENYANTNLNDTDQNNDTREDSTETQKAKETPETAQESVINDVKIHAKTDNVNEIENQQESNIPRDENYANTSLNNTEPNEDGSKIFSECNEETSFPTSKEQVIRHHKFYVHSTWLAVQSSYFRSLFYSGMKESNAKEVHIQILASEEQAHLMLLEAMYKIDTLDNASLEELLNVLKLTHKYDVEFVFKKCKYCLQAMVDSLEVCEIIMRFIKVDNTITDVEDLGNTLQSFLAQEFSPLDQTWQTASFEGLCEPSLRYLLSSNEILAASENTIFHALMHWISENVLESEGMPSILSVVRFELIPIDYLYNIVQHHSIARKLPAFNDHYLQGISYHALSDNMKKKLRCQPAKRKPSTDLLLVHTWVIPRNKLDNLVGTGKKLMSDRFSFSGYTIALIIKNVVKAQNSRGMSGNQELFTAKLFLGICNLTQQSEVSIQWHPESESFTQTLNDQFHTFEKDKCLTSVDLKYKMEKQVQELSSNIYGSNIDEPFTFKAKEPIFSQTPQQVTQFNFGFNSKAAALTFATSPIPSTTTLTETPVPCLSIDVKMKLR